MALKTQSFLSKYASNFLFMAKPDMHWRDIISSIFAQLGVTVHTFHCKIIVCFFNDKV